MKSGAIQATGLQMMEKLVAMRDGFHELLDLGGTDFAYPDLGVVTTRSYLRTEGETLSRFIKAYIEGIHVYKTQRAFTISVLGKVLRTDDIRLLGDTYEAYDKRLSRIPSPTVEGIENVLNVLSVGVPKARKIRAEDLVDSRFVKELDKSGFIDRLY